MKLYDLKVLVGIAIFVTIGGFLASWGKYASSDFFIGAGWLILIGCATLLFISLFALILSKEERTRYENSALWFIAGIFIAIVGAIIHNIWFQDINIYWFMALGLLIALRPTLEIYFIIVMKLSYLLPVKDDRIKKLIASVILSIFVTAYVMSALFTGGDLVKLYQLLQDHNQIIIFIGVFATSILFTDKFVEWYEYVAKEPLYTKSKKPVLTKEEMVKK